MRRIIALLTLTAIAAPALAQSPSASGDGDVLVQPPLASGQQSWAQYRQNLKDEEIALRARIAAHNAQCNAVASDNAALVAQCQQSKAALQAASAAYQAHLLAYQRDFAQPTHSAPAKINIGKVAMVSGDVFIQADDGMKRQVTSGGSLELSGHVTSGPTGHLQVILADETIFTIGPNSDLVLDRFVYDPDTGIGTATAQIIRGMLRFVTGKIHRLQPDRFKVRLNVGTIGIRGTDLEVAVAPDGSAAIRLYSGAAVYTPDKTGEPISLEAGQMLTLSSEGVAGRLRPID